MSSMEGAHGRYETNRAVVVQLFAAPLTERGNCAENFDGGIRYRGIFASGENGLGG